MAVNGTITQTNWTDKAAIQGSTKQFIYENLELPLMP